MKEINVISLVLACYLFALPAQSQNKTSVIIGTKVSKPNAVLFLNPPQKDQGFLPPQLTTSERNNINPASPQDDGLIVFDTDEKFYYYWKNNQWIKGFADQIPDAASNAGKFLSSDGVVFQWSNLPPSINSITAGKGILATTTAGVTAIATNPDNSTITVNTLNQIEIKDNGVSTSKIVSGGNNKVLSTDGSGKILWRDRSTFTDNQKLRLNANNRLAIANANTVNLDSLAAGGSQINGMLKNLTILDNAITTSSIADNAVIPQKILSGGNSKVLTTDPTGVVNWSDRTSFSDDQILTLTGNQLDIETGNTVDLSTLSASGTQINGPLNNLTILNSAVTTLEIADNAVTTQKILSGGNSMVLTTDPAGIVNWTDRTLFTDDQILTLTGNQLAIETGNTVDLNTLSTGGTQINGPLNNLSILNNSISSAEILNLSVKSEDLEDNAVSPVKILSGGNNKVLTTDAGGAVAWIDQNTLPAADPSVTNETITALQVSGNELKITEAGVTLTQDLNTLTLSGDVSGTLNATAVTKLQNNPVNATALSAADNGKVLQWSGTEWVAASTTPSGTNEFYAMDPSQFTTLKPDATSNQNVPSIFASDNTFVTAYTDQVGEEIMGAIHLPHGSRLKDVTIYYTDMDLLKNMSVSIIRKSFTGANEILATWTSAGTDPAINNVVLNSFGGLENIDNKNFTYRVHVTFDLSVLDVWNLPALALQRLYGIKFRYDK